MSTTVGRIDCSMKPPSPIRMRAIIQRHGGTVLIVAALAFFLAMQGGTPYYHPDSLIPQAEGAVTNQGDPGFFNYPALIIYLQAVVYRINDALIQCSPTLIGGDHQTWPLYDVPGHVLTACFSVLGTVAVYGSSYLLTGQRKSSAVGTALLVLSPLWNANSHYLTVDIPLASLCAATLLVLVYGVQKSHSFQMGFAVLLGALVGLSAAAKYNGALIATSVAAVLMSPRRQFWRSIVLLSICGLVSIAVFLMINPYILLDYTHFIEDFAFEVDHASVGHTGFDVSTPYHHITVSLRQGLGILPMMTAFYGAIRLTLAKDLEDSTKRAVLIFPLSYLVELLQTRLAFQRYVLPLIPFAVVLSTYGLDGFLTRCLNHRVTRLRKLKTLIVVVGLIVALGVNGIQSIGHNVLLGKDDTRALLVDTIVRNPELVEGIEVAAGHYVKILLNISNGALVTPNGVLGAPDIMILDSFSHDRYVSASTTELAIDFSPLQEGTLLILAPYRVEKEMIPPSPESLYSPYYPDLQFRERPGPYIEMYFASPTLAGRYATAFQRMNITYSEAIVPEGYFYRKLHSNAGP
ncbi:MAG: glycosyltransferase family 39 protein, partial [Anaerolineae bacterium]|nr:glycosyltransferase family 39 protein [Anaerolineae bacterium]